MENIVKENFSSSDFNNLVEELKTKDNQVQRNTKKIVLLYSLILIIWISKMFSDGIQNIFTETGIINSLIAIAITIYAIYRILNYRTHIKTNYNLSYKETLKKAEKRYRFWSQKTITETIIALLLSVIVVYILYLNVFTGQVFLAILSAILIITLSFIRSFFFWKKNHKQMWISTRELLKEFN